MFQNKNTGFVVGIVAVSILLFGGLIWLVMRMPADPSSKNAGQPEDVAFQDEGSAAVGAADAKVVVHLYSDFQCPACKFAEPMVREVMQSYQDRVRFVWKDFPLEQIHRNARMASNAARCAAAQGKFWEYHDVLYAKQSEWENLSDPKAKFLEQGTGIGLDATSFSACLATRPHDALVTRDVSEGLRNRVDRTPTNFINNRRYFGMSAAEWRKQLDAALAESSSPVSSVAP